jgi:hypothetical protein
MEGNLKKMKTVIGNPINYSLLLHEEVHLNQLIGKEVQLLWTGRINCRKCNKEIKKTFGEGFCYECFVTAPEAAECILRPELCKAHLGIGRDPEWEEKNHNQPHVVYLAASSAIKVGITRLTQVPTRWIDQGASEAIIIAETPNRYEAGRIEVELKSLYTDKTSWQRMLKNEIDESIDLEEEKWQLEEQMPADITDFFREDDEVVELHYPVIEYPTKVKSIKLDREPEFKAVLKGIKGQYLIFDEGRVMNIRSHTGYYVQLNWD